MASNSATKALNRSSDKPVSHSKNGSSTGHPPIRSKPNSSRRSVTPNSRSSSSSSSINDDSEPSRVRVAVRVRPRNAEDLQSDAADCIELQPELKRLMLKKNNWNSDSYRFDEVFTETASQRRVYEVVAKPVVESVLNGYNGTVMAYGQTGTGKTYTFGRLGKHDPSERGIMVRAMEDILANTSPGLDTVEISYLQLYLESIQDLLAPERNNIPISEDPKTGEVSLPGAAVVKVRDLSQFMQLLQIGEVNRHAANTKMNTESSRSHAILMVYIQRSTQQKFENEAPSQERETRHNIGNGLNTLHKCKLLIVDLAGSERIDKSGSNDGHLLEEAKSINLSLTSLGKCINALAENSSHIPTRDSKLTRMLRDSFGGSARTSLIITIGPSARHHAETSSTIMFGQRAMKVVNMLKLKEEFDYESLCRKLENQIDFLTAENERRQKVRDDETEAMEKKLVEYRNSFAEVEKSLDARSRLLEKDNNHLISENKKISDELKLHKERNEMMHAQVARLEMSLKQSKLEGSSYQKLLADTTQMYEKKIADLVERIEDEHARFEKAQEQLAVVKQVLSDHQRSTEIQSQREIDDLRIKLQKTCQLHEKTANDLQSLKTENVKLISEKATLSEELNKLSQQLSVEEKQRKYIEDEFVKLKKLVSENVDDIEDKSQILNENGKVHPVLGNSMSLRRSFQYRESIPRVARIFEEVGLEKTIAMLQSQDLDIQIHAVKAVANLAAEDSNQEKIVAEGGLDALLMLLGSSENTTIYRVASGAVANLAMSEKNQALIVSKGGAHLLANIASKTDDPQTLRMVAGAIANLCGNQKLHVMLKEEGAIKALLGMGQSGNTDVIAQIARGMANFAKCEARGTVQGYRKGRSLLMEDGALAWLISNCSTTSTSTRRHIELAFCHLAQNEENAADFVSSGSVKELVRISSESTRDDIRSLAKKTLKLNPSFQADTLTL